MVWAIISICVSKYGLIDVLPCVLFFLDLDEEAMAAVVCQSDPLPLCKSVQSPPFCCIHPPVKCALCKTLGLSPCCPSYPPGVLVLDKKGESGK